MKNTVAVKAVLGVLLVLAPTSRVEARPVEARVIWVDAHDGEDRADGGGPSTPLKTLGYAIEVANGISPGGQVNINLQPGEYPLEPATITRDRVTLGSVNGRAVVVPGPETARAQGENCRWPALVTTSFCWLNQNPLILVRANDVAVDGIHFQGPGLTPNWYFGYMEAIAFEGQYMLSEPHPITGAAIRHSSFDGWAQAASFNFASGAFEDNVVECHDRTTFDDCAWIGLMVGPSPGGANVSVKRNVFQTAYEMGILAHGTPEPWGGRDYWKRPGVEPASLNIEIADNTFEGAVMTSPLMFGIRDFLPSLDRRGIPLQPGHLSVKLLRNHVGDLDQAAGSVFGSFTVLDQSTWNQSLWFDPCIVGSCAPIDYSQDWPADSTRVTVDLSLEGNTFDAATTASITFQEPESYFTPNQTPDGFWPGAYVQHAVVKIDDPDHDLAGSDGQSSLWARIGLGHDDLLEINGTSLQCPEETKCYFAGK